MEPDNGGCSILSLPPEILEFILSMLPFHRDLPNASLVSTYWCNAAYAVMERHKNKFMKCIESGELVWSHLNCRSTSSTPPGEIISPRYSHAACYHEGFMYMFGGTTPDITYFNDVNRFDLAKNTWTRLTSKNACGPLPKCGASLAVHNHQLIVYGGRSRVIQGLQLEVPRFHSELHLFDLRLEDWMCVDQRGANPPDRACHQAGVIGNVMVVTFGSSASSRIHNDVWLLDLLTFTWTEVVVCGVKPPKRSYHSQAFVNEQHIVIFGGMGERNEPLADAWLLTLVGDSEGFWKPLNIEQQENCPPRSIGHFACQVNTKMIALGKVTRPQRTPKSRQRCAHCQHRIFQSSQSSPLQFHPPPGMRLNLNEAFQANIVPRFRLTSRFNRNRLRNEVLDFHQERFRLGSLGPRGNAPDDPRNECTCQREADEKYQSVHVLNLDKVLDESTVAWERVIRTRQTRSDMGSLSLYTVVNCTDRIVMFGGLITPVQEEINNSNPITNQLSFLSYKDYHC